MTSTEAAKNILDRFDGYEILGCYDYSTEYLFSLTPKGQISYNDDYYLVNKNTGQIRPYAILNDIDRFNKITSDKTKILSFN